MDKYDPVRIENQLCFPLYAAAREVVRLYGPALTKLDLTYTQYITMMVLWDNESMSVKELGSRLFLDSGTLTPVLKSLEKKGYVARSRSTEDERVLIVRTTEAGQALRDEALAVPGTVACGICLSSEEAKTLHALLCKMLKDFGCRRE
ncbi:MAG: MarR family transcriptional regulator [Clostridia bacterium]|nr:MarR family transcriptional regulator [Clostridia bacterium]